jgi:hypothetical protein
MSEIKTLQPLVAPARQEGPANDVIEWNVEGEPQQVVLSMGEIVVLGCPATSDDGLKDAEHNCDVMGCGLCHVLWRHNVHATLTEQLAEAQAAVRAERARIAEKIFHVLRHNNDARHAYPDPCLVCEILNELDELRIELEAHVDDGRQVQG